MSFSLMIGLAVVVAIAVIALVVLWHRAKSADVAREVGRLQGKFLRLKKARVDVGRADLPRWAGGIKAEILREAQERLMAVERSLKNARMLVQRPNPTASENLKAVEEVIGTGENALFQVVNATIVSIRGSNKRLAKFRSKLHQHIVSVFAANASNAQTHIVEELARRIDWSVGGDRPLKDPLVAMAMMVFSAGRLSSAIMGLGEQWKWRNGLIRYRIEAALVRLIIVKRARETLHRIHVFRISRKDRLEAAWDVVVAPKGGIMTDFGLHKIRLLLADAQKFLTNGSRTQEEILGRIISAETLLMACEGALLDVLDPQAEAEAEYAKARSGQVTWGLDLKRAAARVA